MSEPLGVAEREALRDAILDWERNGESGELLGSPADCWAAMEHLAPTVEQIIARRVDRLTEALGTAADVTTYWRQRAERAEADLLDNPRALLDTATEETQGAS